VKADDLRELTAQELQERFEESKEELFNLRFQLATNQLDNTSRLGELRKDVARIATLIRQQELEAWAAQQQALEKEGK
jgi:large subunit ribosomal protein L29